MLKYFLTWFAAGIVAAAIHLFTRTLLPEPINQGNFLFAFWIVALVVTRRIDILICALPSLLILDHYSALGFGLYTLCALIALLVVDSTFQRLFTRRTFYTLFAGALIATLCLRITLEGFHLLNFITNWDAWGVSRGQALGWLFEIILTAVWAILFFTISAFFRQKILLQGSTLEAQKKTYG
jgi:hypothetical protein